MKKGIFVFLMYCMVAIFSLVFIFLKTFANLDISLGQAMMPVWIGIPIISIFAFVYIRLFSEKEDI